MNGFGAGHDKRHPMDSPDDHDGDWFDAMNNAGTALTGLNPVVDTATMLAAIASATQDLVSKEDVHAATTAALLANTRTGDVLTADAVGAFPTIDGVAPVLNQYYLVKNEGGVSSHINNGIYELTVLGDGATAWELTRRADLDNGDHAAGAFVHVEAGTVNGDSTFRCINNYATSIVNTDALEWKFWGQTIDHQYLKNITSSDHHARYTDGEAQTACRFKDDISCAGTTPTQSDFSAWNIADRGIGIGTGGRIFLVYKDGASSIKYVELS